ncbi:MULTISPECIES: phosphoribosyltransferase [unclassified Coleofasciculus]|uniref:phosphoribosyltransferase n=1 Tax=unclassified Coleofasciculus TaxID=2692782 RepID=UPI00187E3A4B|nr:MULTISPECIES: phosphoribosyltransferase family protein [unclassified Coleofasciculus]MBE9129789.1 phosphoribosyltransferase [Coleofasciculus sp. LEGE 07081]MBE9152249.1 phosphoribosyltransferase [Coleofasciculus sp. LEGE 07092]
MSDLYVSWSEYYQKIEQLAVNIHKTNWDFNQIVCVAKGGLRVGDILCRIYNKPLAILSASSYGGADNRVRGIITFSQHLAMTTETLGSRVLLVDDLADSGISLRESVRWLERHYGDDIEEIRTAVLWYKGCSCVVPDYYVEYLPENPWIHQPFEPYECMSPSDLTEKYLINSEV